MNKTLGLQLVVYSLLLAGLSYLVHHLAPSLARPTLIAGVAGGTFCLVWGLRAVAGNPGKALIILTLIPVNFVLMSQTIIVSVGAREPVPGRWPAVVVIALLFGLSIAMVMRVACAGVVLDGVGGGDRIAPGGKSAGGSNSGKTGRA